MIHHEPTGTPDPAAYRRAYDRRDYGPVDAAIWAAPVGVAAGVEGSSDGGAAGDVGSGSGGDFGGGSSCGGGGCGGGGG